MARLSVIVPLSLVRGAADPDAISTIASDGVKMPLRSRMDISDCSASG